MNTHKVALSPATVSTTSRGYKGRARRRARRRVAGLVSQITALARHARKRARGNTVPWSWREIAWGRDGHRKERDDECNRPCHGPMVHLHHPKKAVGRFSAAASFEKKKKIFFSFSRRSLIFPRLRVKLYLVSRKDRREKIGPLYF